MVILSSCMMDASSYPFLSPSWCHQRWSLRGHHPRHSWRNHWGTSSTAGPRTRTDSGFSVKGKNGRKVLKLSGNQRNRPTVLLDSRCGRACSVRYGTGHPPARRYTSLPARGSRFRPGSGKRTGRWTEVLTFDCPPRCRYTSGCDHQMCRSCASLSPCTSTRSSRMSRGKNLSWSEIKTNFSYLVVKHQLGSPVSGCVLAEQRPGVCVNVVPVEVALQRLAVPDAGIQVAAQGVDLTPLGVDTHLVTGASTWTALKYSAGRTMTGRGHITVNTEHVMWFYYNQNNPKTK